MTVVTSLELTNFDSVLDDNCIRRLAANGSLLHTGMLIVLTKFTSKGQILADIDAPIRAHIEFNIYTVSENKVGKLIQAFTAKGSPAQCYNFAVSQLMGQIQKAEEINNVVPITPP